MAQGADNKEIMKKNLQFSCFPLLLLALCLAVSSCKSKPVPVPPPELPELPELPVPSLVFENVEAEDPIHLNLNYIFKIENPFPVAVRLKLESYRVEINGQKTQSGFNLENSEGFDFSIKAAAAGAGSVPFSLPLRLNMDIDALSGQGLAPADDYKVNLILELNFSPGNAVTQGLAAAGRLEVSGLAAFPGVQAPVFSITSIAILKAELVNTRFRVGLQIDNPNPFPVELSAFGYELYGNGRLWADGVEKNILKVNGKSSLKGNLFLIMNFINMKRDLLDQIIYLVDVNYRFTGEAMVGTGVEYLPKFRTGFNLSGYSQVLEN